MALTRIKSSNIEDNAVTTAKINADAVDGTKIADDVVNSEHLVDGGVDDAHLATGVDASKLTGTLPNARIVDLPNAQVAGLAASATTDTTNASNITSGTIADARIPSSAVTQHVDLTSVNQSIATLGLHMGVADNKVAYNLPNAFIDTFEDDTGITTETNVDRTTSEYFASVYEVEGSQAQIAQGTGTPIGTFDGSAYGGLAAAFDGTTNQSNNASAVHDASVTVAWLGKDWGSGNTNTINGFKCWSTNNDGMTDAGNASSGCSLTLFGNSVDNTGTAVNLGGLTGLNFRQNNHVADYTKLSGLTTSTAYRYHWIKFTSGGSPNYIRCAEVQFFANELLSFANATGTLISDTQTAPSATTEVSGVILYKDNAGTATLGTHLKIYFTADNGSNWTEASSYGTAQTFSGTTKQVKLGKTTVTSGTQVAIKAVWASQASGTMETQLHGWAVNY